MLEASSSLAHDGRSGEAVTDQLLLLLTWMCSACEEAATLPMSASDRVVLVKEQG